VRPRVRGVVASAKIVTAENQHKITAASEVAILKRIERCFVDICINPTKNSALEREHPFTLDRQQGQNSRRVGASIDIDPVRSNIRPWNGRMTMHNKLAEVLLAPKKFVTNPEQVFFTLPWQRHARSNAGVCEEKVSTQEARSQIAEKMPMMFRHAAQERPHKLVLLVATRVD